MIEMHFVCLGMFTGRPGEIQRQERGKDEQVRDTVVACLPSA